MPSTWPNQGKIVFQNVYLRYAPNENPVLKNLNIVVESGWKVPIINILYTVIFSRNLICYF